MKKDPAFLFYSKDWIEGTADLLPAEKGVYIDLMAHQHQKGFLPTDTARLARLAGLSEIDFKEIWNHLKDKFIEIEPGKLLNKRLKTEMDERKSKGHKNKIIGQFASLIRQAKISPAQKEEIKRVFKIDDFLPLKTELATERLSKWFAGRLQSIGNGNEDGNGNKYLEEGSGETNFDDGMDIDLIVEKIIIDKNYRDQCEIAGFPPAKLDRWMYAFNRFLKFKGVVKNSEVHWRLGFPAWMAYHNYRNGENPEDYNPVIWAKQKKEDADKILKINGNNNSKGVGKNKVNTTGHSGL